jgi:hypothetical protein
VHIDAQFLKGSIGLLLLNLLSRGEVYGYEILQEASRRSANAFEFKQGTLYPALHQPCWSVGLPCSRCRGGWQAQPQVIFGAGCDASSQTVDGKGGRNVGKIIVISECANRDCDFARRARGRRD